MTREGQIALLEKLIQRTEAMPVYSDDGAREKLRALRYWQGELASLRPAR